MAGEVPSKRWLRASQVAAIWDCNRRTVAAWASRHEVGSRITPGGEHQYLAVDVERVRALLEGEPTQR